jgi:uncharacterized protein DUF4242
LFRPDKEPATFIPQSEAPVPKYVIEREIPGAGNLKPEELHAISQKSCGVLKNLGPQVQWIHSYVTQDKIYCVYITPDEKAVREHARQGGFPANKVSEIKTMIDPTTAE